MKYIYVIAFLLLIKLKGYGQNNFSFDVLTGIGVNEKTLLLDESVKDYTSFTTQINANYNLKIYNNIYVQTGVGLQSYFSSGSVLLSRFRVTTLRFNVPFIIGFSILKKIYLGSGVVVTNNREFNDIDFRANYNFRTSLLFRTGYKLNKKTELLINVKKNLSNTPNLYFVNQPKMDISLGASFKIF